MLNLVPSHTDVNSNEKHSIWDSSPVDDTPKKQPARNDDEIANMMQPPSFEADDNCLETLSTPNEFEEEKNQPEQDTVEAKVQNEEFYEHEEHAFTAEEEEKTTLYDDPNELETLEYTPEPPADEPEEAPLDILDSTIEEQATAFTHDEPDNDEDHTWDELAANANKDEDDLKEINDAISEIVAGMEAQESEKVSQCVMTHFHFNPKRMQEQRRHDAAALETVKHSDYLRLVR